MLNVGDTFPSFRLPDENDEVFDSSFFLGIRHIIFLYLSDSDPDSVKEACDFNDIYQKLMIRNVPVIGISADTQDTHRKFMDEYGLRIKLLSDADKTLISEMEVPSTYIIGKDGKIESVWNDIIAEGHADAVYDAVRS